MKTTLKTIGKELQRVFAALRRPMGWSVIDAFARLEEREEARRVGAEGNEETVTPPDRDGPKNAP
jgi:hypothetical protein